MIPPNRGSQVDRANLLLRPCPQKPREPGVTTASGVVAGPLRGPRAGVGSPHDRDGTPALPRRHHQPRKDRLEEAEAQLQSMRRNTLNEPGCVFMHLLQPRDDPDNWVMLEMFRSRAAWDEHMRQPYNVEGNKILEDLLREPSELRLLDEK